jgi:hypothetical protein
MLSREWRILKGSSFYCFYTLNLNTGFRILQLALDSRPVISVTDKGVNVFVSITCLIFYGDHNIAEVVSCQVARYGNELILAWCGRRKFSYNPFSDSNFPKMEDRNTSSSWDTFSTQV